MVKTADEGFVRVNFSLRGFSKLIDRNALSTLTPNPTAVIGAARILADAKLPAIPPSTFKSIPEFRGLDYVGYVLDKERLDKTNGTWKRLNEFHIIGAKSNSYRDSRVAYGETYRYRLRAVAKWTTYNSSDALNNTQAAISLLNAAKTAIESSLTANAEYLKLYQTAVLDTTNPETKKAFSAATSSGVSLPNGVKIDFSSANWFSFNIASSSATSRLQSLQQTVNGWLAKLSTSKPLDYATLAKFSNELSAAGVVLVPPQKTYVSEYFASLPSRNWRYVTVAEEVLPDPPSSIKIVPCSPKRQIDIYWLPPVDAQRDLAYIKLYYRRGTEKTWTLLQDKIPLSQLPNTKPESSHYAHEGLDFDQTYVYALVSVDLHGYESFMSTQIEAQLNPSFATEQQEKLLRWVSGAGARPDEPTGTVFKKFYDSFEQIIAYKNLTLRVSDTYAEDNTSIHVRVKSLDTHETRTIRLTLKNTT